MARVWLPYVLLLLVASSQAGTVLLAQGKKAMPTAQLPFEPFTPDDEVMDDAFTPDVLPKMAAKPLRAPAPPADLPALGDMGLYAQVTMKPKGFAGSVWAAEYPLPWLSILQSLRFNDNRDDMMVYAQKASLNLGAELHPFRKAVVSPYLLLEGGGERFQKDEMSEPLDLFRLAAFVGLEWRLGRYMSVVGQWVSTFYPDLEETIYVDDKEPRKRFDHAELALNIMWETAQTRAR